MVVLPSCGGYWIEGTELDKIDVTVIPSAHSSQYGLDLDQSAHCYREHFLGKVWFCLRNYFCFCIMLRFKHNVLGTLLSCR